jgi:AcrR family transcriptional regulator
MVAVATRLAAERGPDAVTVSAISAATGAPVGSIYHRFASRDLLVAEVWLSTIQAFQRGYMEALGAEPTAESGLRAALHIPSWVRQHMAGARILLLHRQEDFIGAGWPAVVEERARDLNTAVFERIHAFALAVLATDDEAAMGRATYALASAPTGAVKDYIARWQPPPRLVDELVAETYDAVIVRAGRQGGSGC